MCVPSRLRWRRSPLPIEIATLETRGRPRAGQALVMARPNEETWPNGKRRAPLTRDTHLAAYFLRVILAGKYLEISRPAGTSHIVGLVQLFFICFSCCAGPNGPIQRLISHCEAPAAMARPSLLKWTNETRRPERLEGRSQLLVRCSCRGSLEPPALVDRLLRQSLDADGEFSDGEPLDGEPLDDTRHTLPPRSSATNSAPE